MHWAAHGHTTAELIYTRSDSQQLNMGLTSFKGDSVHKSDVLIAKNYLTENELNLLNRIVTAYLEFAEIQAIRQTTMYMADWIAKLDDFIKMTGGEVLTHAGKIAAKLAEEKATFEYNKFQEINTNRISPVEIDYIDFVEKELKKSKIR